jgi:uncharacterized protein involved in type VI secretion and phage assembly
MHSSAGPPWSRSSANRPALALDTDDVAAWARRRIEAAEAFAAPSEGQPWNEGFVPGGTFTLTEDPLTGQHDTSFVIRNVEHRAVSPYRLSASGEMSGEIEAFYENSFGAVPSSTPWRQPLTVPPFAAPLRRLAVSWPVRRPPPGAPPGPDRRPPRRPPDCTP